MRHRVWRRSDPPVADRTISTVDAPDEFVAFPLKGINMETRWQSVEEIATHLGVNRDTIYKWIDRKRMPAHKVGRLWKFKLDEIDQWVRDGQAGRDRPTKTTQRGRAR